MAVSEVQADSCATPTCAILLSLILLYLFGRRHLRASLTDALFAAGARPDDVVISSDLDEIPKVGFIDAFRRCTVFSIKDTAATQVTTRLFHPVNSFILVASTYFYDTGCQPAHYRWFYGPKVGAFFHFSSLANATADDRQSGINYRRWSNTVFSAPQFDHSAYHLSNFFTVEKMILKMRSFSAFQAFLGKGAALLNRERVDSVIRECKDVFASGRKYGRMHRIPDHLLSVSNDSSRDALEYVNAHFPHLSGRGGHGRVSSKKNI